MLDFGFDCNDIVDVDVDFNGDDDNKNNDRLEIDGGWIMGDAFSLSSKDESEEEEEEVSRFLLFFFSMSTAFRLSSYAIFLILFAAIVAARRFVRWVGSTLKEFVMTAMKKRRRKIDW